MEGKENKISSRPWLAAFLAIAPLSIALLLPILLSQKDGSMSEHWLYPFWILAILSLPWSIAVAIPTFYLLGILFYRHDAWPAFGLAIYVGAFVGTYVNGFIFFNRRRKITSNNDV